MNWLFEGDSIIWHALITVIILIIVMTFYVRINGLRSFAKMSSIDFVTTITIGSVINSTIMSDDNSLVKGILVVGLLIVVQTLFSKLKIRFDKFNSLLENQPILLMKDGEFILSSLKKTNVSKSDIIAKLREANAYNLEYVHAVIMETTGDISVLHGKEKIDTKCILLDDVKSS